MSENKNDFYTQGFFIIKKLFTPKEVQSLSSSFNLLYSTSKNLKETQFIKNSKFVINDHDLSRIVWCSGFCPELLDFAKDSRLLDPVSYLLGDHKMDLIINQAHFKMPGTKVNFPYHQDSQNRCYGTELWSDVNKKGSFVQSIIAIDEVTHDNAPIKVFPKSHLEGHLYLNKMTEDTLNEKLKEYESQVLLMSPGDVVFFHPYLIHGSEANNSTKSRRVFINGYASKNANKRIYPGCGTGMPIEYKKFAA